MAEAPLEYYEVKVDDGRIFIVAPNALKLAELFAGVSDATLERLIGIAVSETFEAGATLYSIGDPAEDIYVLESGRVNSGIGSEDRTTAAGFARRKGEVCGWHGLLAPSPERRGVAPVVE